MVIALLILLGLAARPVTLTTAVAGRPVEASEGLLVSLTAFPAARTSAFGAQFNYVGRCKGCKRGACAADARRVQVRVARAGGQPLTMDAIVSGDRVLLEAGNGFAAACECGRRVIVQRVVGATGKGHDCNAKCLASTGPSCECECRGANHGRSYC